MSTFRILVTGSRTWDSPGRVAAAIDYTYAHLAPEDVSRVVVVHGAAMGADMLAAQYVLEHRDAFEVDGILIEDEPHPADWKQHGKRAGFLRNAEMVRMGADACVAFIKDRSKGATHTADLADRAGIPTLRVLA